MKCRNCKKRIIKVNYALGEEWTHQTEGASGLDGVHRECRVMVAEPMSEQELAEDMYPHHAPQTALINYRAGREVYDTNGDMW